ncbi:hypothetical protein ABN763_04535 [Spongiivirga sp. MCCC 1A20706]|uniref:hypothetical protein n=1 Tax=Spongiivirga sp. MCCC 1A20706 TaxID=3160963 RepID=UPI003977767E
MKKHVIILFLCFTAISIGQTAMPDEIDTSYLAKFEEKGGLQPTPERKIKLALKDDKPILSVILCGSCFPATFTLEEQLSEGFGELVFKNSLGIYMLVYNEKSFAVVVPNSDGSKGFSSVNLYTRSRADYDTITKEKIKKFATRLLNLL